MKVKTLLTALLLLSSSAAFADSDESKSNEDLWKYVPTFNGTFRTFYRLSTATGESRFEVANARLVAGGYVLPKVDYRIQVDFCDNGKIKILDAYARVRPTTGLALMAGQMRVPLSVEATRDPSLYYFADASLTNKFGNLRSVGVKAGYTIPQLPLYFEGGVFNASDMSDHKQWNSALTYSIKANYTTASGIRPEVGFMSRVPGGSGAGVRVNMLNASLSWKYAGLFVEGEYIYRHYTGNTYADAHAWDFFVNYDFNVKWPLANVVSLQARFDGITDASNGLYGKNGTLGTDIDGCRRITAGITATKIINKTWTSFRINFEQYFYGHSAAKPSASDNNQLVAGLVFHF
ncbi:MAG: porin [Muribaculaceae bacterium]|jgi:hypothetical protein|nr:porin [Muribaculaceae bacterium]